jgi:hypothetical protein
MGTERQDPTRSTPTSPDGDKKRQDAQRDPSRRPGESSDQPDEKRRKPEVDPDVPGDDDDQDQPGQSGSPDRERSGSTTSRTP